MIIKIKLSNLHHLENLMKQEHMGQCVLEYLLIQCYIMQDIFQCKLQYRKIPVRKQHNTFSQLPTLLIMQLPIGLNCQVFSMSWVILIFYNTVNNHQLKKKWILFCHNSEQNEYQYIIFLLCWGRKGGKGLTKIQLAE